MQTPGTSPATNQAAIAAVPAGTPSIATKPTGAATKPSSAPSVSVQAGVATSVVAAKLPPGQKMKVSIKGVGDSEQLGSVKVSASGKVKLPALLLNKPGVYTIALKPAKGPIRYLKVKVK